MIEILYLASQIQCGADGNFLNIQVDVYHQEELIETMVVNEKALLPVDSIEELTFKYTAVNNTTGCTLATPTQLVLDSNDSVPNIPGAYEQESIQQLLDGLNEYEELLLVELGTTDETSFAFDLQDASLIVNNNPTIATIFAD